jgi:predicted HTH domain antitoxin
MYLSKSLPEVLVPKYYKSVDNLIEDAFRALLNLKPGLKVEVAIELYFREEVSLSRAAEIAGMDMEGFKEILKMRGLKVTSYIGSKEGRTSSITSCQGISNGDNESLNLAIVPGTNKMKMPGYYCFLWDGYTSSQV